MKLKKKVFDLVHKAANWFKQDSKYAIIFIPKDKNCAVTDMYNLLEESGFFDNNPKIKIFFEHEKALFDDNFSRNYAKKYKKTVLFAHFLPKLPNLQSYNSQHSKINWKETFSNQHELLYAHVCFGVPFLNEFHIQNWISYDDKIYLTFGFDVTDNRVIQFYTRLFEIFFTGKSIDVIYNETRKLYIEEMKYLEKNEDTIGYEGLLANLFGAYRSIRKFTELTK